MKYIIVGLGNFGSYLAKRLTELGHEVVGVDTSEQKVEQIKDQITHAVTLNATDPQAIKSLPMKGCDVVIIAIGEDVGASIMTTAIFKQLQFKRIIGRAINSLHETVIRALGVEEIIHPEEETAERLAKRLEFRGVLDSLEISADYNIVEVKVPKKYIGQSIAAGNFREKYLLNILTVIKMDAKTNLFGVKIPTREVLGVVSPTYVFEENDLLLIFGKINDIEEFLESGS